MAIHTRRAFLRHTAAASLATATPLSLRAAGANERVVLGLIGCGSRGRRFFEHVDYVCDVDEERLGEAVSKSGVDSSRAFTDLRRLLENADIDAVVITTPDHWHTPAAVLACQAGKHVYVEKPISHNLRESRLLVDVAKQHHRVVQHGTQRRSSPFIIDALASLREGIVGKVLMARCWNVQKRNTIGRHQPTTPPPGVDYDLWVGPAEMLPFQVNRFHGNWRWWYNFGTGDIGNDGCHDLDYARAGMGIDRLPTRVSAVGGKYYFQDDQQFPDTATCSFEYAPTSENEAPRQLVFEMRLWSRNYPFNCDSGVEFYGTEGRMFLSKRGKLQILGPHNELVDEQRFQWTDELVAANNLDHLNDFTEAIRNGGGTRCDALEAHYTVALPHLANISLRTGRQLEFDIHSEQFVDDRAANELLGRRYRQQGHWAIPTGV